MKFACMSCGAKYSVPDGRLQAAGAGGLRVRCTRCRAIMVVAESQRALQESLHASSSSSSPTDPSLRASSDEEDTRKELRFQKKKRSGSSSGGLGISGDHLAAEGFSLDEIAASMAGMLSPDSMPPHAPPPGVPAHLSASGVFRPIPGVHRQVTGLFFPELEQLKSEGKNTSSRIWYAAVDERPRGPFSASEMIALAERGKLRDSTMVWRPGFASWKKIKHGESGTNEDLSWLRKTVLSRKLREIDAQERAQQRLGIQPVNLTRSSNGPKKSGYNGGGAGMPPPLPSDSDDVAGDMGLGLDGQLTLGRSRADVVPFAWRADELPELGDVRPSSPTAVRRRQSRVLFALGAAAGLVLVAVGLALAARADLTGELQVMITSLLAR